MRQREGGEGFVFRGGFVVGFEVGFEIGFEVGFDVGLAVVLGCLLLISWLSLSLLNFAIELEFM